MEIVQCKTPLVHATVGRPTSFRRLPRPKCHRHNPHKAPGQQCGDPEGTDTTSKQLISEYLTCQEDLEGDFQIA